jgi:hypothetical protein
LIPPPTMQIKKKSYSRNSQQIMERKGSYSARSPVIL